MSAIQIAFVAIFIAIITFVAGSFVEFLTTKPVLYKYRKVVKDASGIIDDQSAIIASLDAALLRMSKRDYPPTDN